MGLIKPGLLGLPCMELECPSDPISLCPQSGLRRRGGTLWRAASAVGTDPEGLLAAGSVLPAVLTGGQRALGREICGPWCWLRTCGQADMLRVHANSRESKLGPSGWMGPM